MKVEFAKLVGPVFYSRVVGTRSEWKQKRSAARNLDRIAWLWVGDETLAEDVFAALSNNDVADYIGIDPDIDSLGYFITAWYRPKETP